MYRHSLGKEGKKMKCSLLSLYTDVQLPSKGQEKEWVMRQKENCSSWREWNSVIRPAASHSTDHCELKHYLSLRHNTIILNLSNNSDKLSISMTSKTKTWQQQLQYSDNGICKPFQMQVTWKLSQLFLHRLMFNAFNLSFLLTICSVWHDSVWFCFIWIDRVMLCHVTFISKSWGQIFPFATISSLKFNCYRGSLGLKQLRCYAKKNYNHFAPPRPEG